MAIDKIILDEDTLDELVGAWLEENSEMLDEMDEWEDAPDEEALMTVATDAAVALISALRNPENGAPAFEVSNPIDQVAEAFFMGLAYELSASDEAFDAWAMDHEDEVEMEERELDAYYEDEDE
jgi:hypothetical protein